MDKKSADFKNEQNYLLKTQKAIDAKIDLINKSLNERKDIVEELKNQFYSEQYTHEMDKGDKAAMFKRIDDFMMFANEQIDLTTKLSNRKNQPYFGRVDFKQKDGTMPIYVGLCTIDDNKDYYVFDWRAPVGELFYEFGKGKASYETPEGKQNGEIVLKRQYDIQNGKLNEVFDVDQHIFDEYLQKLLSNISSTQLHNIASTIQREQNEVIRDTKNDIIVVQGCVGSGKTTVALHRIAYMLYKIPELKSENIIIFSPNELFLSHISGVLPELGEENTHTATFSRFVQNLLNIETRIENMDEFVSRFEQMDEQTRKKILKKLDFAMHEKIVNFCEEYVNNLNFVSGFKLRKKVFSAEKLNKFLHSDTDELKLFEKLEELHQKIMKECKLDEKFSDKLRKELLARLNNKIGIKHIFNAFLKSQKLIKCSFETVLNFEDAILLCLLMENLTELDSKMDIKQVVFDEVQEYPLLFVDFVTRVFPHAQFSFYGDDAQQTTPGAVHSIKDLLKLTAGYRSAKYYELMHTYRSSEEIVEYSNKIIKKDLHNAFRLKYGQPVEELHSIDIFKQIDTILQKNIAKNRSIGIICGNNKQAIEIFESLNKNVKDKADLIINAKDSSIKQIQVLPVTLAKGLEFDTAIVVCTSGAFKSDFAVQHTYIACTRAINKLYVIKE